MLNFSYYHMQAAIFSIKTLESFIAVKSQFRLYVIHFQNEKEWIKQVKNRIEKQLLNRQGRSPCHHGFLERVLREQDVLFVPNSSSGWCVSLALRFQTGRKEQGCLSDWKMVVGSAKRNRMNKVFVFFGIRSFLETSMTSWMHRGK